MALLEAPVLAVRFGDMVLVSLGHKSLLLTVFDKSTEHPQQCMNPEYRKGSDQQPRHAHIGVIENRIILAVAMIGVGVILGERHGRLRMTLAAGLDQVLRMNTRPRVLSRQRLVRRVTVGTTGDFLGEAELNTFAVIALEKGFHGMRSQFVTRDDLFGAVTVDTDLRMDQMGLVPLSQRLYGV